MKCEQCQHPFAKAKKANNLTRFCSRKCSLAAWRQRKREQLRIYHNAWLHQNQERHTTSNRNWRRRKPEAANAHVAVYRALKRGLLKKTGCEVCGSDRVHAHHDDYSRPLIVRWLCAAHHKEVHN